MAIKIEGLDKVLADFKKFGDDGVRSVKKNIEFSATNIESKAISRAPAQLGGQQLNIKQRIDKVFEDGGLSAKVGVQGSQDLDAWIEFGTGVDFIDLINDNPKYRTPEILSLAETFLGKIRPRTGTLKGTPYLFPSFFEESPELIKRLERDLKNLAGKV
jgi:hypothetical protein